jgi:hypothetical protein
MRASQLLLAAALLAAAAAAATVTITQYANGMCTGAPHTQAVPAGRCLAVRGKKESVMFVNYSDPAICGHGVVYSDAKCSQGLFEANAMCNACQKNFTFSCGALEDAMFWVTNCSDVACNFCTRPNIVPFDNCTQIMPNQWGIAKRTTPCTAINMVTYPGVTDCSTAGNYSVAYPTGKCFEGTALSWGKAAPAPPAAEEVEQVEIRAKRFM